MVAASLELLDTDAVDAVLLWKKDIGEISMDAYCVRERGDFVVVKKSVVVVEGVNI
jgi:hypothetical protein